MHLVESCRIALHCLRVGRLRTTLTMLGLVVSVASVIAGASLSSGLRTAYHSAFDSMFISISIIPKAASAVPGGNRPRSLSDSDINALTQDVDPTTISAVVPIVSGPVVVRRGALKYRANIIGSSPAYPQLQSYPITRGAVFTNEQYNGKARVILLGPVVVNALFGGNHDEAIGSTVQIARQTFEVIGTLGPEATTTVLMPMTTARAYLFGGMHTVGSIGIVATHLGVVRTAINQVNAILDRAHYVKEPAQRDYVAQTMQVTGTIANQLLTLLAWITTTTSAIAMFIGALGLANIMLITVTERTNEIGVRRAIGARRSAILRQFLVEAVLIAGLGGMIGVGVGIAITKAGQHIIPSLAPGYGTPELSGGVLTLAFTLSLVVGLVAGCYPAIKASRLHPWDAVRY